MTIEQIRNFLNQFDFDIRKNNDGRWIDQKCTPDVVCIIADCVQNFVENSDEETFTVNDIWDSPYFNQNVMEIFNKPHPQNPAAGSEYDKVIGQPLKMFAHAQILSCEKHGTTNYYSVKNPEILEFIAAKEINAYKFLYEYIYRVLDNSGLLQMFDNFRDAYISNHSPKQAFHKLKIGFRDFVINYTPINGQTEVYRIFPKVLNVYAVANKIAGTRKGYLSKQITSYSDLLYNQINWRDVGKEKHLTRQEYDEIAEQPKAQAITRYLIQKAKKLINRKYEVSEVQDEFAHGQATQVHHIFPENEYPHLAAFLENLIKLTPQQHYTKAHPNNYTHVVDRDYQLVCLLAKSNNIQMSLNNDEDFYNKSHFIFVINEGVYEEIVEEDFDFEVIRQRLVHYYNTH